MCNIYIKKDAVTENVDKSRIDKKYFMGVCDCNIEI